VGRKQQTKLGGNEMNEKKIFEEYIFGLIKLCKEMEVEFNAIKIWDENQKRIGFILIKIESDLRFLGNVSNELLVEELVKEVLKDLSTWVQKIIDEAMANDAFKPLGYIAANLRMQLLYIERGKIEV